jgi:hypothetical protein
MIGDEHLLATTFGSMAFSTFVFDTPTSPRGSAVTRCKVVRMDRHRRRDRGTALTLPLPVALVMAADEARIVRSGPCSNSNQLLAALIFCQERWLRRSTGILSRSR